MKRIALFAALSLSAAFPAVAEGDAAAGEGLFSRCKSCHAITDGDETIVRGGRSGPNLHGVIGRTAGTVEGFRYGGDMVAAGEAGLVWNEENLAQYVLNPRDFLREYLGDGGAKSSMSFRLRDGGADVAAYLATFSPAPDGETAESSAE